MLRNGSSSYQSAESALFTMLNIGGKHKGLTCSQRDGLRIKHGLQGFEDSWKGELLFNSPAQRSKVQCPLAGVSHGHAEMLAQLVFDRGGFDDLQNMVLSCCAVALTSL